MNSGSLRGCTAQNRRSVCVIETMATAWHDVRRFTQVCRMVGGAMDRRSGERCSRRPLELAARRPASCEPGPAIGCLRGPRCRVVDQRGDLRELDACRGAVEALDAFGELRREECPRCLLGFPE